MYSCTCILKALALILIVVSILSSTTTIYSIGQNNTESTEQPVTEITWNTVVSEDSGILKVASGEADVFYWSMSLNKYQQVDPSLLENITLIRSSTVYFDIGLNPASNVIDPYAEGSVELYDRVYPGQIIPGLILWDPPQNWVNITVIYSYSNLHFNPWGVQKMRYALEFLIDRHYIANNIMNGSAGIAFGAIRPSQPAYNRLKHIYEQHGLTPTGNIEYAQESFLEAVNEVNSVLQNYDMALELRDAADAPGGKWLWFIKPDGSEEIVTVYFCIRVEDERLYIGRYIADLIEKYFYTKVERIERERSTLIPIIYSKNLVSTSPEIGGVVWSMYTEGWVSWRGEDIDVWARYDTAFFYAPLRGYGPNTRFYKWFWYYYDPYLYELGLDLYFGAYTPENVDELWSKIEEMLYYGVNESIRVFLVECYEYMPVNKQSVSYTVPGRTTGGWNAWFLRTMQTTDGTAKIVEYSSTGALFMSPWNTVLGFTDVYSELMGRQIRDFDFYPRPDTGLPEPIRVEDYSVERGSFTIPSSALIYDPVQDKWVHISEADEGFVNYFYGETPETASVKVTISFKFGKWHDGTVESMADVLYLYGFLWEWSFDDSIVTGTSDPYYDAEIEEGVGWILNSIYGIEVVDINTITIYTDYDNVYDVLVADFVTLWPDTAWPVLAGSEKLIVEGVTAPGSSLPYGWTDREGTCVGISWIDPGHAADVKTAIEELKNNGYKPSYIVTYPGFESYDPTSFYDSVISFINERGHAVDFNGPMMVEYYNPDVYELKMVYFQDYIYPAGYWVDKFVYSRLDVGVLGFTSTGFLLNISLVSNVPSSIDLDELSITLYKVDDTLSIVEDYNCTLTMIDQDTVVAEIDLANIEYNDRYMAIIQYTNISIVEPLFITYTPLNVSASLSIEPIYDTNLVKDTVSIYANITLSTSIETVNRLYIDGELVAEFTTNNYVYSWNTREYSDGKHTIELRVYYNDYVIESVVRNVVVDNNPPIINPLFSNQDLIRSIGCTNYVVEIIDSVSIANVAVILDDIVLVNETIDVSNTTIEFTINYTTLSTGLHELTIKSLDKIGNLKVVNYTVVKYCLNISIEGVEENSYLSGILTFNISTTISPSEYSDLILDLLNPVNVYINDTLIQQYSVEPVIEITIDTTEYADGAYTIKAVISDVYGLCSEDYVSIVIDNTEPAITPLFNQADLIKNTSEVYEYEVELSDNIALDLVEILIDSTLYETIEVSGATDHIVFNIDFSKLSEGYHNLTLIAYDAAGNSYSVEYSIIKDITKPSISVQGFTNGTIVSLTTSIPVTVEDNILVKELYVFIDNELIEYRELYTTSTSLSIELDTTEYTEGTHILYVKAIDIAGNYRYYTVEFIVDNSPPQITVNPDINETTISGYIALSVDISDLSFDNAIVYIDEELLGIYDVGSFSIGIDTTMYSNGVHTITIKAFDKAGFEKTLVLVVTIDNSVPEEYTPDITSPLSQERGMHVEVSGSTITIYTNVTGVDKINIPLNLASLESTVKLVVLAPDNTVVKEILVTPGNASLVELLLPTKYYNYTLAIHDLVNKVYMVINLTINIDSTPPEITASIDVVENKAVITWSIVDNVGIEKAYLIIDNETQTIEFSGETSIELAPGKHTVIIKAVDKTGNIAEYKKTINIPSAEENITKTTTPTTTPTHTYIETSIETSSTTTTNTTTTQPSSETNMVLLASIIIVILVIAVLAIYLRKALK